MSFTGDFNVKLDSISLPNENEYIAWHKISDGHFGNELHYHDHYEIFFSLSGNMLYTIEGRQYQLDVGSMLIIAPYEFHQLNEQVDGHAERIGLRFDRKLLASLSNSNCQLAACFNTQNNDFKSKLQFKESEKRELYYLLQGLIDEQDHQRFGKKLAEQSLLTQFFIILNRVFLENTSITVIDDPESQLVRQVLDYMELHYAEPISLEELEKKFYVSRHKITQHFSKLVGYPPYRYLIQKRLQSAQCMLKNGESPQQVAVLCGFSDYSNFYRRFKTTYGCSPRDYYKQHLI